MLGNLQATFVLTLSADQTCNVISVSADLCQPHTMCSRLRSASFNIGTLKCESDSEVGRTYPKLFLFVMCEHFAAYLVNTNAIWVGHKYFRNFKILMWLSSTINW
jgi:hypothetical protein